MTPPSRGRGRRAIGIHMQIHVLLQFITFNLASDVAKCGRPRKVDKGRICDGNLTHCLQLSPSKNTFPDSVFKIQVCKLSFLNSTVLYQRSTHDVLSQLAKLSFPTQLCERSLPKAASQIRISKLIFMRSFQAQVRKNPREG